MSQASAEFITKLKNFLEERNWSITSMAKSAGISTSALSQFIAGKYEGNLDAVKDKIEAVISRETDKIKAISRKAVFVETAAAKRVFEIARNCHVVGEIGVCYSAAGLGKTESVREYAKRHSDVILIEADPCYTAKILFNELRDMLGGTVVNGCLHAAFVECCRRLKGSGRLLIVDEAEQLPYKALELLRRLHDKTGIGILLTGMPKLLANLKGLNGEYAQLYSRVGIAIKLTPLREKDVAVIVDMLLPNCNEKIKAVFHKESVGNTRRLIKMIIRARYIANTNGDIVTEHIIRSAANMVKLEVMS